jgi:hypothetical protein
VIHTRIAQQHNLSHGWGVCTLSSGTCTATCWAQAYAADAEAIVFVALQDSGGGSYLVLRAAADYCFSERCGLVLCLSVVFNVLCAHVCVCGLVA